MNFARVDMEFCFFALVVDLFPIYYERMLFLIIYEIAIWPYFFISNYI
jgi:hypothetical protein